MHILTEYNQINLERWHDLLQKSPFSSWFQSEKAYLFYQSVPDILSPFVFAVENGEKQLKGLIVGYITKDTNPLKNLFTKRAIIYSGPLLAGDISAGELQLLLSATVRFLKRKAIYIETRNFHDYSRFQTIFEQSGFNYVPHYDIHINCSDYQSMFSRCPNEIARK